MKQYLDLLKKVHDEGIDRPDRTGTGRRSIFGEQLRFKMSDGLPLVTTRKITSNAAIAELIWFISGSSDTKQLKELGTGIWDRWAVTKEDTDKFFDEHKDKARINKDELRNVLDDSVGSIGPLYGANWRNAPQSVLNTLWPKIALEDIPREKLAHYKEQYRLASLNDELELSEEEFCKLSYRTTVDQLNELIINLRDRPYSARHVVSAWIPELVPFETLSPQDNVLLGKGALTACHMAFQCFVHKPIDDTSKARLSLQVYIRSSDVPIGLPYNISQYAILLHLLAHVSNMEADELIVTTGDTHIYTDQLPLVKHQLARVPLKLPTISINPDLKDIFEVKVSDITINNYNHANVIRYPVST